MYEKTDITGWNCRQNFQYLYQGGQSSVYTFSKSNIGNDSAIHICIKYHVLADSINKTVLIKIISISYMIADMFIEALSRNKYERLAKLMGMKKQHIF